MGGKVAGAVAFRCVFISVGGKLPKWNYNVFVTFPRVSIHLRPVCALWKGSPAETLHFSSLAQPLGSFSPYCADGSEVICQPRKKASGPTEPRAGGCSSSWPGRLQ